MIPLILRHRRPRITTTTSLQRHFSTTPPPSPPSFDSHEMAVRLRNAGFNEAKTDALVSALSRATLASEERGTAAMATTTSHLADRVTMDTRVHKLELELHDGLASLRNELKSLEVEDFRKLEEELDNIESKLHEHIQRMSHDINVVNERRNATRLQLEEAFATKLERLENRLIRWALGFGGTVALVGLGALRLLK